MKIHIAHSPDSDDAFMFYGLASGKVPTGDLELVHVLSDIETLNRAAFEGKYEISAVSFHAYAHLTDKYILLPHGASMGDNYGPMVVVRTDSAHRTWTGVTVGDPGHAHDGLPRASPLQAGREIRRHAVRRDPRSRP